VRKVVGDESDRPVVEPVHRCCVEESFDQSVEEFAFLMAVVKV